jgi:hypothetical protein
MNEVNETKRRVRGKSPATRLMELVNSDDKDPATAEKIRALRAIVARRDKRKQDTERQRLLTENAELKRKVAELKAVTPAPVTATDIAQLDSMRVAQLRIVAQSESEIGQRARAMVEEYEKIRREEGNDLKAEIRWMLQRQQRLRAAAPVAPTPRALAPVPTRPMSTAG